MKYNLSTPSDLRQNLDVLGAQFDPATKTIEPILVMKLCQNISMAASDKSKPIPDDVFAPGLNDELMRCALSGMCMAVMRILHDNMSKQPGASKSS